MSAERSSVHSNSFSIVNRREYSTLLRRRIDLLVEDLVDFAFERVEEKSFLLGRRFGQEDEGIPRRRRPSVVSSLRTDPCSIWSERAAWTKERSDQPVTNS